MGEFNEKKATCGTVCLKYLLFTFNCCFWVSVGVRVCCSPFFLPASLTSGLWPRRSVPAIRPRCVTIVHCLQLAGLAVMAVGIWTLALKSDYISLLASSTYLATAYILVVAGVVVMVTGVLGCCATFKERRNLLRLVSRAWWHPVGWWGWQGLLTSFLGLWGPIGDDPLPAYTCGPHSQLYQLWEDTSSKIHQGAGQLRPTPAAWSPSPGPLGWGLHSVVP